MSRSIRIILAKKTVQALRRWMRLESTGRNSKEAAEIAAHSTRDRKEILTPQEVLAAHRQLGAEFGNQADAMRSPTAKSLSIQFTAPDKELGVSNRELGTIKQIAEGLVSALSIAARRLT
jgi:hypothetical protein